MAQVGIQRVTRWPTQHAQALLAALAEHADLAAGHRSTSGSRAAATSLMRSPAAYVTSTMARSRSSMASGTSSRHGLPTA